MGIELLAVSNLWPIMPVMYLFGLLRIAVPVLIIIFLVKGSKERRELKREVEQLREDIKKISGS